MFKNLINGEWLDGVSVSRNINPSDTRDLIGEYAQANRAQTETAIAAAHAAFPAWSLSTPQQRFDILDTVGSEILARRAELGDMLAREEGKTLPEAVELAKAVVAAAAEAPAERLAGVRRGRRHSVLT
jgi:aldehyde dehydrogenase (NAD+)